MLYKARTLGAKIPGALVLFSRFEQFWAMRDGSYGKYGNPGNEESASCRTPEGLQGSNPTEIVKRLCCPEVISEEGLSGLAREAAARAARNRFHEDGGKSPTT